LFPGRESVCFCDESLSFWLTLSYGGAYYAQVSLIDAATGSCLEVLFTGRKTKLADELNAGECQLIGIGWDAVKQHVLILVMFYPPDETNVVTHTLCLALLVLDLKRRELAKCYGMRRDFCFVCFVVI
jgi:hypothetical protein